MSKFMDHCYLLFPWEVREKREEGEVGLAWWKRRRVLFFFCHGRTTFVWQRRGIEAPSFPRLTHQPLAHRYWHEERIPRPSRKQSTPKAPFLFFPLDYSEDNSPMSNSSAIAPLPHPAHALRYLVREILPPSPTAPSLCAMETVILRLPRLAASMPPVPHWLRLKAPRTERDRESKRWEEIIAEGEKNWSV